MTVIFFLLLLMIVIGSKFYGKNFNEDYLSKNNTLILNGFFICIVFMSHFLSYNVKTTFFDNGFILFMSKFNQLMVVTFLFFSGYGIYESIKNKKNYMKNFLKNRFWITFVNFNIALLLFLFVNFIIGTKVGIINYLLSTFGWKSIGNSNWYMFDTFILYFIVFISYFLCKNNNKFTLFVTIFTIIFACFLYMFKDGSFWYDTIMCFPAGMYYSKYKNCFDKFIQKNNLIYLFCIFIISLFFFIMYYIKYTFGFGLITHNILSITFVIFIAMVLMKFELNNKLLKFFGEKLFWIYILQRLPMIIFYDKMNYIIYFIICIVITLLLTEIMISISKKVNKMLKI